MRTLAAIMFTDIEGYTALMQQDEGKAIAIRNTHRKYFNEITAQNAGKILQYYGDGTLSIFSSAHEAVRCGIELQQAYGREGRIPVRIGIHLGEIIFNEEEIIGDAVNIASRIESLAKVGSVLISEKVLEEIKNQKTFRTKLLGAFEFKNVFRPLQVFAIIAEGLNVPDGPELAGKTVDTAKIYDLPLYANAFIGRDRHLNKISALLEQQTTRLISLLGPGGIGKTRLAVKVAELVASRFEHGVCFVPLDMVTDYRQVPLYIGYRFGLKESFRNDMLDEIIKVLAQRQLLLILDNLEQILETTSVIASILHHCPRVKIVVTSRELLGLTQEIQYPLDRLGIPDTEVIPGPKALLNFDAIHLFVQKAKSIIPDFQLTEENAPAIVKICQQLDGLPLPIELAAARVKLFSPQFIRQELEKNTDLLKTQSKGVAFRHQTIRETIKWSYDLLNEEEQLLFLQLSLFRSGFTPASLEAVCKGVDAVEVIESFINKSLIIKDKEIRFMPRFSMLKLIRDFGAECLEAYPEKDRYYDRFARYFQSFLAEALSKLQDQDQSKWMTLIDAEYENLAAALDWLKNNRPETALEMAARFWRFHLISGFLRDGLEMVEGLLTLPIAADPRIKARLMEGAGALSHNLGNYLTAKEYFKNCLDIWKTLQDQTEISKALNNLGWAEWRIGNYAHAVSYSEDALEICRELNDLQGQARSLNNLAWTFLCRGSFEKAENLQRQILHLNIRVKNDRGIAFAKTNLAWALQLRGRIVEAESIINESIKLFEALKDQQLIAFSWVIKAFVLSEKNNIDAAVAVLNLNCLPIFEKIGDVWGIAFSNHQLGKFYFMQRDFHRSRFHLNRSIELFRNSNDRFGEASSSLWLGILSNACNDFTAAEQYLDKSLELAAAMEAKEILMAGYAAKALRAYQQREMELVIQYLAVADHYAQELGPYEYNKFRLKIEDQLEFLRQFFGEERSELSARLSSRWPKEDTHLDKPLDKEALRTNMLKLLEPGRQKTTAATEKSQLTAMDPVPATAMDDPFVRKARQIIENHLNDPQFGARDLCRHLSMSHSQVHRRLRAVTGLSVTRFIRGIRLDKAKKLLRDPELTVTAVAYDTGFKDPDYFYRIFKQTFEMTPKEFRNAGLNK